MDPLNRNSLRLQFYLFVMVSCNYSISAQIKFCWINGGLEWITGFTVRKSGLPFPDI